VKWWATGIDYWYESKHGNLLTERQRLCVSTIRDKGKVDRTGISDIFGGCICEINDRSSSKIEAVSLSQLQRHCTACVIEWKGWEATTIDICEKATSVAVWGVIDDESWCKSTTSTCIAAQQAHHPCWLPLYNFGLGKPPGKWRSSFPSESPFRAGLSMGDKGLGMAYNRRTWRLIAHLWRKCEDWNRQGYGFYGPIRLSGEWSFPHPVKPFCKSIRPNTNELIFDATELSHWIEIRKDTSNGCVGTWCRAQEWSIVILVVAPKDSLAVKTLFAWLVVASGSIGVKRLAAVWSFSA